MNLTILFHSGLASVAMVQWFFGPKASNSYACGLMAEMSLQEFRAAGHAWVLGHFSEFEARRVSKADVVRRFGKSEVKKYMEGGDVIRIQRQPSSALLFIPVVVRQHSWGRQLEKLETEKRRTISGDGSPELFWQAFDEVLSFSHEYAV